MTDIGIEPRIDPPENDGDVIGVCAVCGEAIHAWEVWYALFNTVVCDECVMASMHTGG